MVAAPQPLEIFYSYAHEDEALRDTLEKHLSQLKASKRYLRLARPRDHSGQ